MKRNIALTVVSLLSLLLLTFHFTGDVMLQAAGANKYPIPVFIFAVWLYGTLMLADRPWGYVIMFFGGLISAGMIVIHSRGAVLSQNGGYFFVWTMLALGATGWVMMILSVRGLWTSLRTRRAAASDR